MTRLAILWKMSEQIRLKNLPWIHRKITMIISLLTSTFNFLFNYTRNGIHYENHIISWLFRDLKRSYAETPSKELQSLHYCEFIIKIKATVWYNVIGQNVLSHTSLTARLEYFKHDMFLLRILLSRHGLVWDFSPTKRYYIY